MRQLVRLAPVPGQLSLGSDAVGGQRGRSLERLRETDVQRAAFSGEQILVNRLAHERMPEGVALAVGLLDQHMVGHGFTKPLDQHGLGCRRDVREQPMGDRATGGGDRAQHLLRLRTQRLHAHHEGVPQRAGHDAVATLLDGGEQLFDEEGVALGALEELLSHFRVRAVPEYPGELGRQLEAREGRELDAGDGIEAFELGQEAAQRVAAVELVRPVGPDDDQAFVVGGAAEEREEIASGAVGPVQVLDDQHQRMLLSELPKQPHQELEQAGLREFLVAARLLSAGRIREEPAELASGGSGELGQLVGADLTAQVTQGGDDGGVGQLAVAQLDAVAAQHPRPGGPRAAGELSHEAALAYARLPRHQEQGGLPRGRAGQRLVEGGQLLGAADEGRARNSPHAPIIPGFNRRHGAGGELLREPGDAPRGAGASEPGDPSRRASAAR